MYKYEDLKESIFTDEGQRRFLRVRDFVKKTLATAGAVRMQEAIRVAGCGDSWEMLACVDRMVELGEIREITQANARGQDRVFVEFDS